MKGKLMVQSLSPLALLTIVRNWEFIVCDSQGNPLSFYQFVASNIILLSIMAICAIWIILSVIYYFSFWFYKSTDKSNGYIVTQVKEQEDASLNFFMTLILPLLIDDVNTIPGALTFVIILALMCLLLWKTCLFYANPVLAILGYRIYEFSFESNKDYPTPCIGICKGTISNQQSIEYKKITKNILYIRRV